MIPDKWGNYWFITLFIGRLPTPRIASPPPHPAEEANPRHRRSFEIDFAPAGTKAIARL